MKTYSVIITDKAASQLERYLSYLVNQKKNIQAAIAVSDDYDETIDRLGRIADSLRYCDDTDLRNRNIRKIFFMRHDYVMLYRIEGDAAVIEAVYHTLQNYENLFKRES